MTREELYAEDRGEREYYESKRSLKERIKLPVTKDGIEALLEVATKALDFPLDDTTREVFCGYVHHLDSTTKHTSLGEVGDLLWKHFANNSTWTLDQECKERRRAEKARLAKESETKDATDAPLALAKESGEQGQVHS